MGDLCLFSFYEDSNGKTVNWSGRTVGHPGPLLWSDALKFTSGLTDFTGIFGLVYSGTENCLDLNNRCKNVKLTVGRMIANGGKFPVTVKGGCEGITIEGVLDGHGTECDIDAGNKSDQSSNWVKNWELAIHPTDGKPVRIRCLLAEAPRLRPGTGPYTYLFPSPHAWYHGVVVWFFKLIYRVK